MVSLDLAIMSVQHRPLEVAGQDAHQLPNPAVVGRLFAEQADDEILVVLRVENHQLVLPIGDAQPDQLQRVRTTSN